MQRSVAGRSSVWVGLWVDWAGWGLGAVGCVWALGGQWSSDETDD